MGTLVRQQGSASSALAAAGLAALLLGALVYLTDRSGLHALSIPAIAAGGSIFGVAGQWLPSFVHTFAFSLLTAATRPTVHARAYSACAAWWAVNIAFEVGQHEQVKTVALTLVSSAFGETWLGRWASAYFLHGSFDIADMAAATMGALTAAVALRQVHCIQVRHG